MARHTSADGAYASEILEVTFNHEEPPKHLKGMLEGLGLTIHERRPDGQTVVWECHVPPGDTMTPEKHADVERMIQ